MRRNREILRQKWALGRSHREVALSLDVSTGAITAALARAKAAGLSTWEEAFEGLSEAEFERRLYHGTTSHIGSRPMPDWAEVHAELAKKGVTRLLLHLEYLGG